jgi:hypothetical protein
MTTYAIHPSSPINSVGQIKTLVIAATSAIRALWVFASLFWKQEPTEFAVHASEDEIFTQNGSLMNPVLRTEEDEGAYGPR